MTLLSQFGKLTVSIPEIFNKDVGVFFGKPENDRRLLTSVIN